MKNTMLAAVVYGQNQLKLEQVLIPGTIEKSLIIKVMACAICGTDMRIYKRGDYRAEYPVITGHEIAAVVQEVASGVIGINVGDRVCVAPGHGCGFCRMCKSGQPNVCTNSHPSLGYKLNGGFAEYMVVPEHIFRLGFVNRIPDELSFDEASMSEIIACCLNAQLNAQVNKGDTVLILGAGPAGIIHAHLARERGAKKIIISQRSQERLDEIKTGFPGLADILVSSKECDLREVVLEETEGIGADAVFVCAPSREAQEIALELVGNRGRVNFFGGLPKEDCMVRVNANQLHYKEFMITGASSSLPETNREALEILRKKIIDPNKLITHKFPLSEIDKGFAVMESKKCIKVVINP